VLGRIAFAAPKTGTFVYIASGDPHTCAIKGDASVFCWGNNDLEQLNAPTGSFTQSAAGGGHSCDRDRCDDHMLGIRRVRPDETTEWHVCEDGRWRCTQLRNQVRIWVFSYTRRVPGSRSRPCAAPSRGHTSSHRRNTPRPTDRCTSAGRAPGADPDAAAQGVVAVFLEGGVAEHRRAALAPGIGHHEAAIERAARLALTDQTRAVIASAPLKDGRQARPVRHRRP